MRALAEALFCAPEGPPPAARLDWLDAEVADVYCLADGGIRFLIRLSVLLVSVLTSLYVGRLTPMRRLPLELRMRGLGRLERGSFAGPLMILKALICLIYYEHPDVEREVGVAGFGRLPALKPTVRGASA
jgi:hypothetical protein